MRVTERGISLWDGVLAETQHLALIALAAPYNTWSPESIEAAANKIVAAGDSRKSAVWHVS
jgi:hypothetical protein